MGESGWPAFRQHSAITKPAVASVGGQSVTELNQAGFERLLELFDADRDKAADKYLKLRRVLNFFFERDGVRNADELTDETIGRVTQKLASGVEKTEGEIRNVEAYCQQFAKFVLLEDRRERQKKIVEATGELPDKPEGPPDDEWQQRLDCVCQCLQNLRDRDRELFIQYETVENRNELAARLRLTISVLRQRACKVRQKLRKCVIRCMKKSA